MRLGTESRSLPRPVHYPARRCRDAACPAREKDPFMHRSPPPRVALPKILKPARALFLLAASVALATLTPTGAVRAQDNKGPEWPTAPSSPARDWQVVCKPPPAGAKNEVCALVQSVTAEDRPNVGLTVYFQKFLTGHARPARVRARRRPSRPASASRSTMSMSATRPICAVTPSPATRRSPSTTS